MDVNRNRRRAFARLAAATLSASALAGFGSAAALPLAPAASAAAGEDRLLTGQQLGKDQRITSADGRYSAVMQGDGNFVLYGPSGALWSSRTAGSGADRVVVQGDGNLVVYRPDGKAVFATGTRGADAKLVMQNDGNLVLYTSTGAVWSSGTAGGKQDASGYRFVLPHGSTNRAALGKAHHDYPAADIPVPTGTEYYATISGTVSMTSSGNACGLGYLLRGDDGVQYTYCHGSVRSVADGSRVSAGQLLGKTGETGSAKGAHLHFQVRAGGKLRCPQPFLQALYDGVAPPDPKTLPEGGCTYGSR